MKFVLDPITLAKLEDRWSDISPEEGTEECICMLCAKMIGADECDPRWDDHEEIECGGCELCEIAIRIWSADGRLEMRFHSKCFEQLLAKEED